MITLGMDKNVETKGTTRRLRWPWEKLGKAKTADEVKAAVEEAAAMLGTDDIQIRLSIPPQGYLRLMGDAWLAYKYGETRSQAPRSSWTGRWRCTASFISGR